MSHHPGNPLDALEYARLTGFDGKWRETWWNQDFLALLAERGGFGGTRRLLDVGCGAGHWGRTLRQILPDARISGVDIESAFIERCRVLATAAGLEGCDYQVAPAENLPYPDETFDLVTCQTVMIHLHDPAVALQEMKRVLKPGGSLLLAEPNNLTGYLNSLLADPRPAWEDVLQLLDFYRRCLEGKKALKMGDSSVGERLPLLITQAGFAGLRVAVNENCPALIPPYGTERQTIEREFLEGCLASGAWMGFGPESNARRFFLAAGGDETGFARCWELTMRVQEGMLSALRKGKLAGGRAPLMYVHTARRP